MKKIIFYTDTPIAGGAEKQMLLLAQHLDKKKYKVMLVCSNNTSLDRWVDDFFISGFEVKRLTAVHKHDPRHYFGLKKILNSDRPDLLHIHVWNPASCRYAFLAAQHTRTKTVMTEHDPFPLHGLKNFLKKGFLRKVNSIIAVSEANKTLLLSLYPFLKNKIRTIHNGIDADDFQKELQGITQSEKVTIRHDFFGVSHDEKVILSIAALHPRKGLKYLLKGFAEVYKKNQKVRLVIVGEGPEKHSLENLKINLGIDNVCMLLGYQSNIPKILKSSDIFVLPSVKEAFGLVLLEAMAAGVPIIASNVGGIPEIIKDQLNGILVEPGNCELLSEKIEELLNNPLMAKKFVTHGYKELRKFSAQHMAEETQKVYDGVINSTL